MPRPLGRPPVGDRLRAIREATGMTQTVFAAKLDALSVARFGAAARRYSPPTVSKIETGAQKADFDDVELWAALDPLKRGKLWLAWAEPPAESLDAVSERAGIPRAPRKPAFGQPAEETRSTRRGKG